MNGKTKITTIESGRAAKAPKQAGHKRQHLFYATIEWKGAFLSFYRLPKIQKRGSFGRFGTWFYTKRHSDERRRLNARVQKRWLSCFCCLSTDEHWATSNSSSFKTKILPHSMASFHCLLPHYQLLECVSCTVWAREWAALDCAGTVGISKREISLTQRGNYCFSVLWFVFVVRTALARRAACVTLINIFAFFAVVQYYIAEQRCARELSHTITRTLTNRP